MFDSYGVLVSAAALIEPTMIFKVVHLTFWNLFICIMYINS